MRFRLVPLLLAVVLIGCGLSGCGISQTTKQLVGQTMGYDGIFEEYLKVTKVVLTNHLAIIKQVEQKTPNLELDGTDQYEQPIKIKISDYRIALEAVLKYPDSLVLVCHAVNDAIQADKGISSFTEQLLRTLQGDKLWKLLTPPPR